MKMRLLLVAATLLLFCVSARADSTIVVDVTGSTCDCWPGQFPPFITVDAQFTVVASTDSFWYPAIPGYISGAYYYQVTGMTGTLNGQEMSLASAPTLGAGWWLESVDGQSFDFGWVCFNLTEGTYGGGCFLNDFSSYTLVQIGGAPYYPQIPLGLTLVATPDPPGAREPASLALMVVGILATAVRRTGWKDKHLTV